MRLLHILIIMACSGCYMGLSGGAYQIEEPSGKHQHAWSLGVTAGYYIVYGSTRLSVGRGMEVSAPRSSQVKSYGSSIWTARLDRPVVPGLRVTGIAGMENDAWAVLEGMDGRIDYPTGKQRFLYGGLTYHYHQLMVSGGPAYLHWATNEMGTARSLGAQLRVTLSFNLADLASAPSLFGDGECGNICKAFRDLDNTPSKPKPRAKTKTCSTLNRCDATHGTCTRTVTCTER